MHPKYRKISVDLAAKLDEFQASAGKLPSIASEGAKQALIAQFIESRCRQKLYIFGDPTTAAGFGLFGAYFGDCPDKRALDELP